MKILVIGSGGREHALIRKLRENPSVAEIYALPGNGGIANDAVCVPIKATDIDGAVEFAVHEKIDFCVVAPDDPLCMGLVDAMEAAGIPSFGPDKKAAEIEGSKVFSKWLMQKYNIPTARYAVFEKLTEALAYIKTTSLPVVIKADGLALGKGVVICHTHEEASQTAIDMMENKVFGESGARIVIEEYLTGPEVSVLAFTDGETLIPMVSAMDHKKALEGNLGLNTGGMGTIAPNPYYTKSVAQVCMDTIFLPTIQAMCTEGRPFRGCLFFGLMLTKEGPKVIEYNCRFGDPETQVVLPLLKSDLLSILRATRDRELKNISVEFSAESACCVILASGGYPGKYETGFPINGLRDGQLPDSRVTVFHAGDRLGEDGRLVTSGGRVLGVTATAASLPHAIEEAYKAIGEISFTNMVYRRDIGSAFENPIT